MSRLPNTIQRVRMGLVESGHPDPTSPADTPPDAMNIVVASYGWGRDHSGIFLCHRTIAGYGGVNIYTTQIFRVHPNGRTVRL